MTRLVQLTAAAAVLCAACGGGEDAGVQLSATSHVEGDHLIIEGATNLPDSALIAYEVRHERQLELPADSTGFAEGHISVAGGSFSDTVSLAEFPAAGSLEVWVAFQTIIPGSPQPASVLERYGEMGERITGESVTEAGGLRRVEVTQQVAR